MFRCENLNCGYINFNSAFFLLNMITKIFLFKIHNSSFLIKRKAIACYFLPTSLFLASFSKSSNDMSLVDFWVSVYSLSWIESENISFDQKLSLKAVSSHYQDQHSSACKIFFVHRIWCRSLKSSDLLKIYRLLRKHTQPRQTSQNRIVS